MGSGYNNRAAVLGVLEDDLEESYRGSYTDRVPAMNHFVGEVENDDDSLIDDVFSKEAQKELEERKRQHVYYTGNNIADDYDDFDTDPNSRTRNTEPDNSSPIKNDPMKIGKFSLKRSGCECFLDN